MGSDHCPKVAKVAALEKNVEGPPQTERAGKMQAIFIVSNKWNQLLYVPVLNVS